MRPLIEAAGVTVNLSRTNHEPLSSLSNPDFFERTRIEQSARIAAVGRVRLYVSIHFDGHPDSRVNGTHVLYNRDNFGPESLSLAQALQRNVVPALQDLGYPVVDRGVKEDLWLGRPYGHLFSLRGGMPSALVEGLFLSNPTEAALLLREETRDAIARGYVGGILEYLAVAASAPSTP